MANISASARAKDTMLFCGAVIKNVRDHKTFSFQSLYVEATGKRNPNKAYKLRDALIAVGVIKKHRDGSYYLTHQNFDSAKVVADVTKWLEENKPESAPKRPNLLEGLEIRKTEVFIEDEPILEENPLNKFSVEELVAELRRRHVGGTVEVIVKY